MEDHVWDINTIYWYIRNDIKCRGYSLAVQIGKALRKDTNRLLYFLDIITGIAACLILPDTVDDE